MHFRLIGTTTATQAGRELKADLKAFPRVLSRALTELAYEARLDAQKSMRDELDRPTRFSQNAIIFHPSNPRILRSAVLVNPKNQYLDFMTYGGTRQGFSRRILIPARRLRTSASGNITRARRRSLVNDPRTFSKGKGNRRVLLRRRGADLEFIGALKQQTRYKRSGYWKFHESAFKSYDRHFNNKLNSAYNRLIR